MENRPRKRIWNEHIVVSWQMHKECNISGLEREWGNGCNLNKDEKVVCHLFQR